MAVFFIIPETQPPLQPQNAETWGNGARPPRQGISLLIFPVPVKSMRFLAAELVFIFGISVIFIMLRRPLLHLHSCLAARPHDAVRTVQICQTACKDNHISLRYKASGAFWCCRKMYGGYTGWNHVPDKEAASLGAASFCALVTVVLHYIECAAYIVHLVEFLPWKEL